MMKPDGAQDRPAVFISAPEEAADGEPVRTVTILEVSFASDVEPWRETRTHRRPADYAAYKQRRCERLLQRLEKDQPDMARRLRVLDTASMLTFRDYLNNAYGAAYGIKQKIGQFNLIGRLPLANLYAAGQSALLPGVVGAMASSFFVCRSIIGKSTLQSTIESRLCH
jgi:phytoene dehydrogenase-like protein